MAAVTVRSDFGAQEKKNLSLIPLFPHLFLALHLSWVQINSKMTCGNSTCIQAIKLREDVTFSHSEIQGRANVHFNGEKHFLVFGIVEKSNNSPHFCYFSYKLKHNVFRPAYPNLCFRHYEVLGKGLMAW